jgi:hypothetical protein
LLRQPLVPPKLASNFIEIMRCDLESYHRASRLWGSAAETLRFAGGAELESPRPG